MKQLFSKKKRLNEEMSLQITSMADIFTIILVFLLKSFSTNVSNLSPSTGLELPEGRSSAELKDALKVEITKDVILVDQKPVMKLSDFQYLNAAPESSEPTNDEVTVALMSQRKILPEPNRDSALLVLADGRAPYSTIKRVISSAAGAGFVDLQLVVVSPD